MFLVFSNHFDVLISKNNFKKIKNIILMHFNTKTYFKKQLQPHSVMMRLEAPFNQNTKQRVRCPNFDPCFFIKI
jgi:hypothetical protein